MLASTGTTYSLIPAQASLVSILKALEVLWHHCVSQKRLCLMQSVAQHYSTLN